MERKQTVGQATVSMVLGILSLVILDLLSAMPMVIFGHIAKDKIKKNPEQLTGEGPALADLIMGYISMGLNVLVVPSHSGSHSYSSIGGQYGESDSYGRVGRIRLHWISCKAALG